jgi:hypothetical protein
MTRRAWAARVAALALGGLAMALPSCEWDGQFTILGYTTKPNYDTRFKTVSVPIFRNKTFWTVTPAPGLEMDLTQAVVREIQARTPYRVVECNADTELTGTVIGFTKASLNTLQFNYPREVETTLVVELVWRDLRTGEVLTRASRRPGTPLPPEIFSSISPDSIVPGAKNPTGILSPPGLPPEMQESRPVAEAVPTPGPLGPTPPVIPIVLRSVGHFIPELGQSLTTAQQENINRMAIRITEVMEKGW